MESRGVPITYITTSMFSYHQNNGTIVNGVTPARRTIMDHSLMAMAEQYTVNMGSSYTPATNTAAINFLKQYVLNVKGNDYPDKARMEFWGVADMTALEMAEYALTAPLTEKERNPAPLTYYDTMMGIGNDPITVKARNYSEARQIFNKIAMLNSPPEGSIGAEALARKGTNKDIGFYGNFGDGLALVPPTRELVDEMLRGSKRSGWNEDTQQFETKDDVISWMKFQSGAITPEKVAINAVMAGAKPEHFPVILAALELMASGADFDKMWYHGMVTGSDSTLHIMLNGPLAVELGMSGDAGSYGGAGNQVNNVIGRAIRMCFRNIGHISLEMDDHQYKGREHDFAMMAFREQEELLPNWNPATWNGIARPTDRWVPYHVYMGFRPDESTITIWAGNATGGATYGGEPGFWMNSRLQASGTGTGDTSYFFPVYDISGQTYNTLGAGAINVLAISPGMAKEMYETHNITSKTALINTARASSGTNSRPNSLIPVVAGGSLNSIRLFGNYDTYGRQNHQIQLISGATLTTYGRAASRINPSNANYRNNVALQGKGSNTTAAFLDPAQPGTTNASSNTNTQAVPGGAYMPSAPRNVNVTFSAATNGNADRADATITWDEPIDKGNSNIIAYQIAYIHNANIQFFITTDVGTSATNVDMTASPQNLPNWYSGYVANASSAQSLVNGANRIYTILSTNTAAFGNRTFTFRNMPRGFETFFRVRAISDVRNSVDLDGSEDASTSAMGTTHSAFTQNLSIRTSGRGAWGQYKNGKSVVVPINRAVLTLTAPVLDTVPVTRAVATSVGAIPQPITWTPALPASGKFAPETAYTATFNLIDSLGDLFNDGFTGVVTLNGTALPAGAFSGTGNVRTISYTFPATGRMVTSVALTMTAPVAGATNTTAVQAITVEPGSNVTAAFTSWNPTVTSGTGTFLYDQLYAVNFTLTPASGYVFPSTLTDLAVTVNSLPATVSGTTGTGNANRTVTYTFPTKTAPKQDLVLVELTMPTPPALGLANGTGPRTINVTGGTIDGGAAATGTVATTTVATTAYSAGGVNLGTSANFAADTVYKFTFTLNPGAAYNFPATLSSLVVKVNNIYAVVTGATGANRTVEVTFPATDPVKVLDALALTMPVPTTGGLNNATARTVTVAGGTTGGLPATAASIATITVSTTSPLPWTPSVNNNNTTAFAANTSYTFTFTIAPGLAYTFAENLAVTINGSPATVTSISGTPANRTITVIFPATDPVKVLETVNLTVPNIPAVSQTNSAANRIVSYASATSVGGILLPSTGVVTPQANLANTAYSPSINNNTAFVAGQAYTLTFTLTLASTVMYSYPTDNSELAVYVNGYPAVVSNGTGATVKSIAVTFPPAA